MDSTINLYFVVYVFNVFIHILCYTTTMENKYRHTKTTVSLINYHFVFCPRYRRKIFLIPNVEERFKELVKIKCKELDIEIIAIECFHQNNIDWKKVKKIGELDYSKNVYRFKNDKLKVS